MFAVVGAAGEEAIHQPCTAAQPCVPEPIGFASLGLLVATVVTAFLHRPAARWLATAFVVVFLTAGVLELEQIWWVQAFAAGFEGLLCWLVLWPGGGTRAAVAALPAGGRTVPPRPDRLEWPPDNSIILAGCSVILCLFGAAAWLVYAWHQGWADSRQASATQVVTEVVEHGASRIWVALDDGSVLEVDVLYPTDYPVGSQLPLLIDNEGLTQPVSEPYDAGGWMIFTGFFGGMALAAGRVAASPALDRRWALSRPQPVRRVRAVGRKASLILLPPPGRTDALLVPVEDMPGLDATVRAPAGTGDGDLVRPATLYGTPAEGQWCVLQIGDEVVVATGPAKVIDVDTAVREGWELVKAMIGRAADDAYLSDPARRQRLVHLERALRELLRDPYDDRPAEFA